MRSALVPATLAATVLATGLLAGCSDDSGDGAATSATSGTTGASGTSSTPADPGSTNQTSSGTSGASSSPESGSAPGTSVSTPTSATSSPAGSSTTSTVVPQPKDNSRPTSIAATPGQGCVPIRVDVPSVGITEPIVAMGTNSQGQIYPPARTTMWYDKSPQPGDKGVSVVAGHVTYDGPDDFYELDRVAIGASVSVKCSNGRTLAWKVTERQSVNKTALTRDARVWGSSETPVVALITCDRASKVVDGHHLNNYVVWVRPA